MRKATYADQRAEESVIGLENGRILVGTKKARTAGTVRA